MSILSHDSLWSKNAFLFAEFFHDGIEKTEAVTASVEEGL